MSAALSVSRAKARQSPRAAVVEPPVVSTGMSAAISTADHTIRFPRITVGDTTPHP